ncbi:MAG TPA: MBL fold metallo-hydrolase [Myxococcaceae bacterium]|nr:MBL fold metallo-hydrolase [Myxococcaceae bacterium]
MATLQFLGAAGTVTGSRFLLEHGGHRVLVECGLFQGRKEWRELNWADPPVDPRRIDAVVLTHAHIDHTGGLPRLVRSGFAGPVFATPATRDLAALLLPDSAYLQEEEARYANQRRYSKHSPALPLYTVDDAYAAIRLFETVDYQRPKEIAPGITLSTVRAGHILGSAICAFDLSGTDERIVFTGDLGRYGVPILRDPEPVARATALVAESTYGDREHREPDPEQVLAAIVNEASNRGGVLVIPAFAVGRTQEILYRLRRLEDAGRIPTLDVYIDSPMACDATPLYLAHPTEHDVVMTSLVERGRSPLATERTHFVTSAKDSKRLNAVPGPAIIISASGMATGGRILHHLAHRLPNDRNTVLFVGYQAEGTRGRRLLRGEKELRIHGEMVGVEADIRSISGFSAHADWREMLRWMEGFEAPPRQTLLVHGEPAALDAMAARVRERGWTAHVPRYLDRVELGGNSP